MNLFVTKSLQMGAWNKSDVKISLYTQSKIMQLYFCNGEK